MCGNTSYPQNARQSKIVGGVVAIQGSWPAQIFILQTISGLYKIPEYTGSYYSISESYICGGTLLNSDTVLTAAHCIVDKFNFNINGKIHVVKVKNPFDASQFNVFVGAYDLSFLVNGINPSYPTVQMSVRKVIRVKL